MMTSLPRSATTSISAVFVLAFSFVALALLPESGKAAIISGTVSPGDPIHTFFFEGEDKGGIGSATMTILVTDLGSNNYKITATVANTSPTTYGSPAKANTAAIMGFGFDVNPDGLTYTDYSLTAYKRNSDGSFSLVILGDSDSSTSDEGKWTVEYDAGAGGGGGGSGNVQVDLYADSGNGAHYALYNQALGQVNPNPYYSLATLELYFTTNAPVEVVYHYDDNPKTDATNDVKNSPYVRFQRVGNDGSLKLTPSDPPVTPEGGSGALPEPASLAVWGLGLGLVGLSARRRMRKA